VSLLWGSWAVGWWRGDPLYFAVVDGRPLALIAIEEGGSNDQHCSQEKHTGRERKKTLLELWAEMHNQGVFTYEFSFLVRMP
jgi:hypothetical protein